MIQRPIALVLGAGASKPYNFPTARELLRDVRDGLTKSEFRIRLHAADFSERDTTALRDALTDAHVGSVDEFLELPAHKSLVGVGKAAIAAALLSYENPKRIKPDAYADDWYQHLFRRMKEGAPSFKTFLTNRVVFVTFNYDRSLEYFFLTTLRSTYGIGANEIASAMHERKLRIVHVYGSLGALPDMGGMLPYGADGKTTGIPLKQAADSIQIVGEPGAQSGIDEAEDALMSRERVCFLGFGYRRANVQRLSLKTTLRQDTAIFGSAYDMRAGERLEIVNTFRAAGHEIELANPSADALGSLRDLSVLSEFELGARRIDK